MTISETDITNAINETMMQLKINLASVPETTATGLLETAAMTMRIFRNRLDSRAQRREQVEALTQVTANAGTFKRVTDAEVK